ncbi:MAG: GEVED domain-containing protein, partial [Cyanobacteria bacterium J06598_3]
MSAPEDSRADSPLYHDVLGSNGNIDNPVGGVMSASPQYPIFFNEIDPAVLSALPVYDPLTGIQTSTGFPLAPILPVVSAPLFAGNLAGATSSVGAGGNFFFDSNLPSGTYEIVISGDGVDFDPYGPNNKLIRGFMTTSGLQTVAWDGFANGGTPFPTGTFPYKIEIRGGEYHFPMSDVENNPFGGPIYNLLNAANPRGNTVGFYDHRGYVTSSGVTVADRNPADGSSTDDALCGDDPPNPPAANLVDGSDSAAPGFNRFGNLLPEGNTNVQCTGTFGDTKTLDLWTYFPSDPPQNALIVIKPTDFGDAPDTSIDGGIGDYTTLLQHNGPRHGIAPLLVYLGQGATDEPNGFVDGVDDQGNGTDDADDAFVSLAPIPAGSGSYTLNTIPVNNDSSEPATLYAWIDFNRNGEFESSEYAQSVVAPGDTTTALSWAVPALTSDGISYARFRLTTDALSDDETNADLDERSMGGAADGEVEDYSIELNAVVNGPKVLLVKRVTAISNTRDVNPNDGTV